MHLVGQPVQPGVGVDLVEGDALALEHRERQPLLLQRLQDRERAVRTAIIEEHHMGQGPRVVANKGLDDVVLVQDPGDGDEVHRVRTNPS